MLNNEIRQLQKEKEYKIKSMDIKEIKQYIERNIAYYYSHYANTNAILNKEHDKIDGHIQDAKEFQETFFNNLDLMIDNIKNNTKDTSTTKQMKINYILAILYSCFNDNLVLNIEQEAKQLEQVYQDTIDNMEIQVTLSGLLIVLVSFVNKAYDLLNNCKKMLLVLYTLSAGCSISETEFYYVNTYFKGLFLEFYLSYLCSKNSYIQVTTAYNEQDKDVENIIESAIIRKFFIDAKDKLKLVDEMFKDVVKPDDLFAYPKESLHSKVFDNSLCYSLKTFDVYHAAENNANDDGANNNAMCDEYKTLLEFEKQYNISLLNN